MSNRLVLHIGLHWSAILLGGSSKVFWTFSAAWACSEAPGAWDCYAANDHLILPCPLCSSPLPVPSHDGTLSLALCSSTPSNRRSRWALLEVAGSAVIVGKAAAPLSESWACSCVLGFHLHTGCAMLGAKGETLWAMVGCLLLLHNVHLHNEHKLQRMHATRTQGRLSGCCR